MRLVYFILLLGSLSLQAKQWPSFQGNILDDAKLFSSSEITEIHQTIEKIRSSGIWAAIYTLPSLENETIESVAEIIFRTWKLGSAKEDNGLLIVIAKNDRKMRIEVGYGLEGTLTDLVCNFVIQSTMKPEFRNNNFAQGVLLSLLKLESFHLKQESLSREQIIESTLSNQSVSIFDFNPLKLIGCILLNCGLLIIFWLVFLYYKIIGKKIELRWFNNLLFGHGISILLTVFFYMFWQFAPLIFIIPFNLIFAATFGGRIIFKNIKALYSEEELCKLKTDWIIFEQEKNNWLIKFKVAEESGNLKSFLAHSPRPVKPTSMGSFFSSSSSYSSSSSSNSSYSSDSSSSSSSSDGGSSGGGGASGDW